MNVKVAPATVQYGDQVAINGHVWIVKGVNGPDHVGAFDFYLTDGQADKHEVITDAVSLVY